MERRQRKKNKMEKYCDNCKVSYPDNISYCPKCGKLLIEKNIEERGKIKFVQRFLLPILFVLLVWGLVICVEVIDNIRYCATLGIGWMDLIVSVVKLCIVGYLFDRIIVRYSGNPYIFKFGLSDQTYSSIEKNLNQIVEVSVAIVMIIAFIWFFVKVVFIDLLINKRLADWIMGCLKILNFSSLQKSIQSLLQLICIFIDSWHGFAIACTLCGGLAGVRDIFMSVHYVSREDIKAREEKDTIILDKIDSAISGNNKER